MRSLEHCKHLSESLKGRITSPETILKLSLALKGRPFTKQLKERIKARDNYCCRLCKSHEKLYIHHIDYDKTSVIEDNLISLCLSCHVKTNYNRNCWKEHLIYKNEFDFSLVGK